MYSSQIDFNYFFIIHVGLIISNNKSPLI